MISPGIREPDGAMALDGVEMGAGSAGRGRGTIAGVLSVTSTGFVGTSASFFTGFAATNASLNIGAGCEPDCMNNTLKRMAIVANAPTAKPAASLGLHPSARNGWGPRSSWTLFPRPARVVELRTSIHPNAGRQAAAGGPEQRGDACPPAAAPNRDPRVDVISERSGQIHVYVHARCLGRASPLFAGSMVSEAA